MVKIAIRFETSPGLGLPVLLPAGPARARESDPAWNRWSTVHGLLAKSRTLRTGPTVTVT